MSQKISNAKKSISPQAVREGARVVGWGLGAYALVQLIGMIVAGNSVGAESLQALAAEFAAGKLGVAWSDPEAPLASTKEIAMRAARGALFALGAAVLCVVAVVMRGGNLAMGHFAIPTAAIGLLSAGLASVRDELLLRGVVLRAFRHLVPSPLLFAICGLAGAAARMGNPDATPIEIVASGALAIAFAAAWIHDRGGWMAWGAHTAWIWISSTLARGTVVDVTSRSGGALDADTAGVVVLAVIAVISARLSATTSHPARIRPRST